MTPPELLVLLLLAIPVFYASAFVHELGHAVMGKAAGFVVTSFGLGTGRPFCVIPAGGMRIYFGLVRPFQGIAFWFAPQLCPSKWRLVASAVGGILANVVVAVLSLSLLRCLPWGHPLWLTAAVLNGLLAMVNLIPFRSKVGKASLRTDGALILQAFRSGSIAAQPPMTIQTLALLRGLWLAIGDTLILRMYLWNAAQAWAGLGDLERADALNAEADALPGLPPPSVLALGVLMRAGISMRAGRLDEADQMLDSASAAYHAMGREVGLVLVSLNRANLQILRGDAKGAAADLDVLRSHPVVIRHRELAVARLVTRFDAAAVLADTAGAENFLAEYEALRRVQPSAVRDLSVYRVVAQLHAAREDWVQAEPAYRRALAAIAELVALWNDPAERARFLEAHSPLMEEARQCFQALGKVEDAEELIGKTRFVAALGPDPERNRRLRRLGLRIMLVNTCSIIGAALIVWSVGITSGPWLIQVAGLATFWAAVATLFTITGALYLAFDLAIGRFIPGLRTSGGAVILFLACCPWLALPLAFLEWLFGLFPPR